MKKYRISSAGNLWDSYEIEVDKDGYIVWVSNRNDIVIGSLFKSIRAWWEKFDGENGYVIEELKDGKN